MAEIILNSRKYPGLVALIDDEVINGWRIITMELTLLGESDDQIVLGDDEGKIIVIKTKQPRVVSDPIIEVKVVDFEADRVRTWDNPYAYVPVKTEVVRFDKFGFKGSLLLLGFSKLKRQWFRRLP